MLPPYESVRAALQPFPIFATVSSRLYLKPPRCSPRENEYYKEIDSYYLEDLESLETRLAKQRVITPKSGGSNGGGMRNTGGFAVDRQGRRSATRVSMATKTVKNKSSKTQVRYIVNDKGERTEVVLPIDLFERLLDEVEELQDIRDFDEAMEKGEWEDFEEAAKRLGV